ncbi:hypothetical protein [Nostoc linckia]|uniref:hypothetical protein n=1 Tax=Nostoc linckia TaxID=92942 RepID=UPI000C00034A|nr:hypothetical protein [Nostoc linckia]
MAIEFDLSRLTSRVVRSDIGQRVIRGLESSSGSGGSNGSGNAIVDFFFNGAKSLGGFLMSTVGGFFKFSWTGFWSWFVATKQFIWNFNWNATDSQLDANIKAKWTALAGQFGGTLGNAFGYIACGILPGVGIMAFNEPLGAFVLAKVTEEALEEFTENFGALLKSTLILGTQMLLTASYKNVRKALKANSKAIGKLLGGNTEKALQAWGEKDSKPWSFASATEEFLDNTFGTEGAMREFVEEFLEEADEACVEAGYVVANAVDTFLAQDMLARRSTPALGNTRYVEITPNREIPDERIVLGGREELLRPVIIQTLATEQQFAGRDMGIIYGSIPSEMPDRRHKPEVVLKFYQKQNNDPDKGAITQALSMEMSFRLMNKSKEDFATDDYLKSLSETIYKEMCTPPFKANKGKQTYTYADHEKGYQFKLDVKDEAEAKRIIKKVLDIQGHKMNDDLFRKGSSKVNNSQSTTPERVTIRGERVEIPQRGKEGEVTFQFAYLNVGVNVPPINLVDLTGKKKDVVYVSTK